jgi:hypothetical protein
VERLLNNRDVISYGIINKYINHIYRKYFGDSPPEKYINPSFLTKIYDDYIYLPDFSQFSFKELMKLLNKLGYYNVNPRREIVKYLLYSEIAARNNKPVKDLTMSDVINFTPILVSRPDFLPAISLLVPSRSKSFISNWVEVNGLKYVVKKNQNLALVYTNGVYYYNDNVFNHSSPPYIGTYLPNKEKSTARELNIIMNHDFSHEELVDYLTKLNFKKLKKFLTEQLKFDANFKDEGLVLDDFKILDKILIVDLKTPLNRDISNLSEKSIHKLGDGIATFIHMSYNNIGNLSNFSYSRVRLNINGINVYNYGHSI